MAVTLRVEATIHAPELNMYYPERLGVNMIDKTASNAATINTDGMAHKVLHGELGKHKFKGSAMFN